MCLVAVSLPWMSEPFQSALMSSNLVLSLIRIGMPCEMSALFSVKRRKPVCVSLLFFLHTREEDAFIHCCCILFYSFLSSTVCKELDHQCPNLHLSSIKLVKIMLPFFGTTSWILMSKISNPHCRIKVSLLELHLENHCIKLNITLTFFVEFVILVSLVCIILKIKIKQTTELYLYTFYWPVRNYLILSLISMVKKES